MIHGERVLTFDGLRGGPVRQRRLHWPLMASPMATGFPAGLEPPRIKIVVRAGLPDGEVLVRTPTQMSGYYGADEPPIDAQGWLHTGDLGRIDEHDPLWITGRSEDMIIRGGENIAPAAVERALMKIPGVQEAAVFAVPSRWRLQQEPLPMNNSGKVDKPALVPQVLGGIAAQGPQTDA